MTAPCTRLRRLRTAPTRQEGAALIVSLLLVIVLTLLGLTSMQSSTVETALVANENFRQTTFNAAEAAAEQAIRTLDPSALDVGASTVVPATSIDSRVSVAVSAHHEGMLPIVNTSLRLFGQSVYSVEAVASSDDVATVHVVTTGASQRVPLAR